MLTTIFAGLFILRSLSMAQPCATGYSYNPCHEGTCNSDPNAVEYLQACIYPLPGACQDAVNARLLVKYTDTAGAVSTATAINPATSLAASQYYFDINIPHSAILDGSPVSQTFVITDVQAGAPLSGRVDTYVIGYRQTHIPTITTATTTTTATAVEVTSTSKIPIILASPPSKLLWS